MPTNAGHPADEVLEQHSLGQLSEPQQGHIEDHLLVCGECQRRLGEMDEYIAAMRTALDEVVAESSPVLEEEPARLARFFRFPKPAWAGALAAIVLIALVLPFREGLREPFTLVLETHRGITQSQVESVPADRPLDLNLILTGLPVHPSYAANVANATGEVVWRGKLKPIANTATLSVENPLEAGQYWVRVYHPAGEGSVAGDLLREFSLRVE
ncbi:MAG: hypothetical protein GY953_40845 [bacterium]|nr:hypothetical protein [bacterium]